MGCEDGEERKGWEGSGALSLAVERSCEGVEPTSPYTQTVHATQRPYTALRQTDSKFHEIAKFPQVRTSTRLTPQGW
jgi:hypothetical protein